jgi:general secretion pathway protein G
VIPADRQRNYLQAGLYVIIVGVAAAILLERLLTYAEAAEKVAMEVTLSQLNSALYARMAYLAMRGEYEAIEALPSRSPFLTAQVRSPNYLGEFDGVPPDADGGNWLYDRARLELVYVPRLARHFAAPETGGSPPLPRYRVEVYKTSKYAYTGVAIKPVGGVKWEPLP